MPTTISLTGAEPVDKAAVKLAARVDTDALDDMIDSLITSAREQAEHLTGRTYRPQVLREELADWPAATDAIAVCQATACAVSYWTGSAWSAPLNGSAYVFAAGGIGSNGTVLAPATGTNWPTLGARPVGPRVRIDLTAGPAAPADVPARVKLFVTASVAAWLATPEAQRVGQ
ncbi:hypothetical protein DBR42_04365, partial [Pelomonas sp. HMWF004]